MRQSACIVIATLSLTLSASALAEEESAFRGPHALLDRSPQQRPQELSFWAGTDWAGGYGLGLGIGVRYAIPVVQNGFIKEINNSVELEFGGDFGFLPSYGYCSFGTCAGNSAGFDFDVSVEARWTFHFTERFAAYGKIGLGLGYFTTSYGGYTYIGPGGQTITVGGGTFWQFLPIFPIGPGVMFWAAKNVCLRAEVTGLGLRVGVGIDF